MRRKQYGTCVLVIWEECMRESLIDEKDVLEVIRSKYDELFPAERKTADYVLSHADETVLSNVSELARASGVSDATIIRLAHHLGYTGYYQFRLALSRDLGKKQLQDAADAAEEERGGESAVPGNMLGRMFEQYASRITRVGQGLDMECLFHCVSLIGQANAVHIIAVGNTSNIGAYMGFRLERLGVRCTCSRMPEYFINHISLARENDIVLAISKSGSSRRVMDAMKLARDKKLKMILISADRQSPAAALADYVLDSGGGVRLDFEERKRGFSYLNEFITAEALIEFVANATQIRQDHAERMEWFLAENKL